MIPRKWIASDRTAARAVRGRSKVVAGTEHSQRCSEPRCIAAERVQYCARLRALLRGPTWKVARRSRLFTSGLSMTARSGLGYIDGVASRAARHLRWWGMLRSKLVLRVESCVESRRLVPERLTTWRTAFAPHHSSVAGCPKTGQVFWSVSVVPAWPLTPVIAVQVRTSRCGSLVNPHRPVWGKQYRCVGG
jgi:hypothetical protein